MIPEIPDQSHMTPEASFKALVKEGQFGFSRTKSVSVRNHAIHLNYHNTLYKFLSDTKDFHIKQSLKFTYHFLIQHDTRS